LAVADYLFHLNSREGIEGAIRLVPGNADYHKALGEFETARKLNPRDSTAWIRIGLNAEMQGHFDQAGRALVEAARVDRTFEPSWALANYYFRRNNRPKFWLWVRKAAEMNYDDATVIFRLCWRITEDPNEILQRAIPNEPVVLRQYLGFLLAEKRMDAAVTVAERLLTDGGPDDVPMLVACCDRLLAARSTTPAIHLWNGLAARKLIATSPARAEALVNGDFRTAPTQHGFDWFVNPLEGVAAGLDPSAGLRITLSGKQPERCEILRQFVPVRPGQRYIFRIRQRASSFAVETGLRWRVYAPDPIAGSTDLSQDTVAFTTPSGADLVRLALLYERTPGTTRPEGSLWLESASLEGR
jgi:hypothetical protein